MNNTFVELTVDQKNLIASLIEFNNAKECEARQFYYDLLNKIAIEDKYIIDEIIQDELDHTVKLCQLSEKYGGNFPNEFQPITNLRRKKVD